MRGKKSWEKTIDCEDGSINIHITEAATRKVEGIEGDFNFVIPYRIGIDFYDFKENGSHDWIPNVSLSDLVQLINYLTLLQKRVIREALHAGIIHHKFGVELDFQRKLDLDLKIDPKATKEKIEMYYEDPARFERFLAGWIDVSRLPRLVRALKECVVEYTYRTDKLLLTW